jgi:hypothetical protein
MVIRALMAVAISALLAACSSGSGGGTDSSVLQGDFVAGGIVADDAQSAPGGDARIVRFDGAGTATWTGQGKAFADFPYEAGGDGALTLDSDMRGVLGYDGEILVMGQVPEAYDLSMWAAVKASPWTRTGTWRGDYFGFSFGAREGDTCWVSPVQIEPDGFGKVIWREVGKSGEGTYDYGIRDGILSVMGSFVDRSMDHTTGAVTTDGNVVIVTDLEPPDLGLVIAVRLSSGNALDMWRGTYECYQFGMESYGASIDSWASHVTVDADGAGHYQFRSLDTGGATDSGAGTYVQKIDGTLTIDNGLSGIVSADGGVVLLGRDDGGEISFFFGIRR